MNDDFETSTTFPAPTTNAHPQGAPEVAADGLPVADLTASMIRTVVSNGNDALRLLFQAAAEQDPSVSGRTPGSVPASTSYTQGNTHPSAQGTSPAQPLPASPSVLHLWSNFRFVKMGWLTPHECVMYMDLFFRDLAPLSLISRGMDASHDGHFRIVAKEPLLCCVILLISSRYHSLSPAVGAARGVLVHQRLWEHCQHLIMRIISGQEKGSTARTRTRGSVEALILMVEWHPRAIYFPPPSDGWDSGLLHSAFGIGGDEYGTREDISDESDSPVWQTDVVKPARTSDRMAWMLLGCAQTLALELGIYDGPAPVDISIATARQPGLHARSGRVREVLLVLMEQHSFRLGCPSMVPESLARITTGPGQQAEGTTAGDPEALVAVAWLDLTRLLRSMHDVLFPSAAGVKALLRSGRYASITRHFQHQLIAWRKSHLDPGHLPSPAVEELCIEYHHSRAFMNSLGAQAIVDRILGGNVTGSTDPAIHASLNSMVQDADYDFIREVVDGSVQVLESTKRLFATGSLRFCPVRIFLRVIASSVLLLKALSLGTSTAHLRTSLACLQECIACLKASSIDEGDLVSRYSSLLRVFLAKFEQGMVPASAPHALPTLLGQRHLPSLDDNQSYMDDTQQSVDGGLGWPGGATDTAADDWLALPVSHSLAPFQFWDGCAVPEMETEGSFWDNMWNLPIVF
ncbi:hypothetical protein F5X68DRAFT_174890 [Plectosphaerella plurivora]|uniref:C6 transcription factor n=1 Tax=Plectosphaerella plurivora TaxID=936078 RepID=A0A9P8V5B2_9PEZI|nr:hypothetical protein F5X68DRAFT_174890 [Plectosphaerella plurivora]